jgi:hypothetical protein
MKLLFSWAILCFLLLPPSLLLGQRGRGDLCFVWYNVENLFHPANDSLPVDDEFTPEGLRHWTQARYQSKLTALAKVIIASGGWEPPELVGLCEVEEALVLEDLVAHPILEPYHYAILHHNSPDHRGMDVACLYRPERIGIHGWSAIHSRGVSDGTRDIVHVCLTFGKRDTLDLFLVHLISKYRGAGATAQSRRIQAGYLLHCMDSVRAIRSICAVMAAGDFNDDPESYSMEPLRLTRIGEDSLSWISPELPLQVAGTYKYRARWSHLDQIHWYGPAGRFDLSASVLDLPPLMIRDEVYGGLKPRRTYNGYKYAGGLSDHLPLVVQLRRIPVRTPAER